MTLKKHRSANVEGRDAGAAVELMLLWDVGTNEHHGIGFSGETVAGLLPPKGSAAARLCR